MGRLFIKSAIIGAVSSAVIIYCVTIALAVLNRDGHISDLDLRLGPITVFAVWADASGHHFTVGTGVLLIAGLVGLLNGVGAVLLNKRRSGSDERVG